MATPDLNGGVVGISLQDVPLTIRRRYGRYLHERAARAGDLRLALQIQIAVEQPSAKVYWLPARRVQEVRERQGW